MAFDIERADVDDNREYLRQTSHFVAELLSTSLSFSFESLEEDPDAFVKFHDATSKLRTISLNRIDLSSSEAVCIFVNLYHCLLQHALLLTVNGPLYKVRMAKVWTSQNATAHVISLFHSCLLHLSIALGQQLHADNML
jgi:hypothetical protein